MKFLFIPLLLFLLFSCNNRDDSQVDREKYLIDSVNQVNDNKLLAIKAKNTADSLKQELKQQQQLYVESLMFGDSLFFIKEFSQAQIAYNKALENTSDTLNHKILLNKIANCTQKINNKNDPIQKIKEKLLGRHAFGVQLIWDGYGKSDITQDLDNNTLSIIGSQYSNDKSEYCLINGTIEIKDENTLIFNGIISTYIEDACKDVKRNSTFTFRKTKNRKYWRLKEFHRFCPLLKGAYYIDIFE